MNRLVSQLTVIMLLGHLVLGCCWHHAHACVPACGESREAATEGCLEGLLESASNESIDQPCEQHHGRHVCQDNACVYLRTPVENEWEADHGSIATVGVPSPAAVLAPITLDHRAATSSPGAILPPIRLHLANQVLRI
ncbi:MAG: hypothetical protein ACYC35_15910 [Pirellulales bacterium]